MTMKRFKMALFGAFLFLAPFGALADDGCANGMQFSVGKALLEQAGVRLEQVDPATQARAVHDYDEANGEDAHVTAVYLAVLGDVAKIIFVDVDCVVFATPAVPLQRAMDLLGVSAT